MKHPPLMLCHCICMYVHILTEGVNFKFFIKLYFFAFKLYYSSPSSGQKSSSRVLSSVLHMAIHSFIVELYLPISTALTVCLETHPICALISQMDLDNDKVIFMHHVICKNINSSPEGNVIFFVTLKKRWF